MEGHTLSSIQFQKEQASERAGRRACQKVKVAIVWSVRCVRPFPRWTTALLGEILHSQARACLPTSLSLSSTWESPEEEERKLAEIKT